ncbi:hypothetical protein QTP70_027199 [Hemibagrus guttatus]|uniref:Ecto-NOX disulfide-thiol exchanger 1/2 domain-containing protein n=1 Tax=Hemibagrus guttatus TaxID=175788 RepID=A0AAE0R5Y3_9TELE|nr:hypothetical protein QTP70_027199 [Hemibagrus guttatus]
MLEHGVCYGQALTSTEVQQQDTTRVQIRGAVPPNHAPPGITVIAHMGIEIPQQNYGVPRRSTFQHPSQGLQEGWVLHTAVRPISRNNSETPIPGPKAQGNNPLIYRGKLQHMAVELGGYKQAHPSPPPLTMGHSREEEGPTSLKELGSRAQAVHDSKFSEATAVLFTWIERGEVNRRTANQFYSMIQSANSHVRRLMNEKAQHEEEMEQAKEHFKNSLLTILTQFEQITGVFSAATRQKAWDHFSKAQRKNIDIWRKQCEELRNAHSEEIMGIRREEEMEMSDEDLEENPCKKVRMDNAALAVCSYGLREENDSLRWQLDAYRNEVELLKKEQGKLQHPDEENSHEHQLKFLQQTMHSMQQQLLRLKDELKGKELELEQARDEQRYLEGEIFSLREKLLNSTDLVEGTNHTTNTPEKAVNGTAALYQQREKSNEGVTRGPVRSEKEALLLGVISTFLHVHPFGANIEYLWSYIQRLDAKISASDLERLMVRLPNMFKQEFSGVGATLEKRWKFCGFEALSST